MLTKYTYQILQPVKYNAPEYIYKTAGVRRVVPIDNKEFRYLVFRAIGCMEDPMAGPNGNWDGFPYEHFEDDRPNYGYKSFIGKRAHVEHNCFIAGTPILMSDFSYKNIEDVQEGDKVWCHDGNIGVVKETFINYTNNGLYHITAEGILDSLSLTEGHPIQIVSRADYERSEQKRRNELNKLRRSGLILDYYDGLDIIVESLPEPKWVKAEDLKVGDFLVIPHLNIQRIGNPELSNLATILGLYVAEGCTTGLHQRTDFSFHKNEQDLIEKVYEFGRIVGKNVTERFSISKEKIERYGEPNCVIVTLHSSEISNLLVKHAGRLAKHKKLSDAVMTMPVEWQREFLNAYFEGDAFIDSDSGIKGSTASRELALQIQRMLLSMGVWCNVSHYTQHTPNDSWVKNSFGNDIYVYSIKPSEVVKLFGNKYPMNVKNRITSNWLETDNGYLVSIKSIERTEYCGNVYNFEVTSQNSYIAYNVSVHNSNEGVAGSIGDLPDAFLNRFIIPKEFGVKKFAELLGRENDSKRLAVLNLPNQTDGSISVLMRIDTKLVSNASVNPKVRRTAERIIRMIDTGQRLACSMGCNIEYSVCSACGNVAHYAHEYCFIPDTLVLMSDYSVRPISEVNVGDEVIDAFGKPTKVLKTFVRDVMDETIYSVCTRTTPTDLWGTGNHPFLTKRRNEFTFTPLKYIADNEILFSPTLQVNETEELFDLFDFEKTTENKHLFSRFLGYYAAEGCVAYQRFRKNGTASGVHLYFNKDEHELIQDVIDICQRLFGYTPKQYLKKDTNYLSLRIHISSMATTLVNNVITGTATTKRLSSLIMRLPKEYVVDFLRGYFDGDGHADDYGRFTVVSASKDLSNQVYYLLTKFGVTPSIGSYENSGGPNGRSNRHRATRISIGNRDIQVLSKLSFGNKISKAASYKLRIRNNNLLDGNLIKHRVFCTNTKKYTGKVYNIETESGTYVANNTSVHNCDHIKNRKGAITVVSANHVRDLLDNNSLRPEWLQHLIISKRDRDDILKSYSNHNVAIRNVEINHVLSFFELSVVANPAFPRAIQLQRIAKKQNIWTPLTIDWRSVSDDEILRFTEEAKERGLISTSCALR